MSMGLPEILLIAFVVMMLFGAKRIPELARALGRAHREYNRAKDELADEAKELMDSDVKDSPQKADAKPEAK
ncbi:MAG: twin-arginine translocase TatA/TatE family subunit [Kiritimatiellia bacterium]